MNFSSGTEKNICFFFLLRGNTIFGYEWINDQRTFPCKKKYGNFETGFIIIDPKFCTWKIKSLAWKKSFLCAWKFTANTWKLKKKSTWKIQTLRENFEKSVREKRLPYVKKMKKWPKKRFTHTFYFHVQKIKSLSLNTPPHKAHFFWFLTKNH